MNTNLARSLRVLSATLAVVLIPLGGSQPLLNYCGCREVGTRTSLLPHDFRGERQVQMRP